MRLRVRTEAEAEPEIRAAMRMTVEGVPSHFLVEINK
jgi:hypothetical protein